MGRERERERENDSYSHNGINRREIFVKLPNLVTLYTLQLINVSDIKIVDLNIGFHFIVHN